MHKIKGTPLRLEDIVNHLEDGVLCCKNDAMLTIVYANASFYEMIGYKDGEITVLFDQIQKSVVGSGDPIDPQKFIPMLEKDHFANFEIRLVKKDGHHIWVSCHIGLMAMEDGMAYFCGIISDITQKRLLLKRDREQLKLIQKARLELAESEERYRIIMEQAADPICDYNFKTQELYCSYPFVERFGLDVRVDGLLDKLYHSDLIFHEDRARIMCDIYGIIDGTIPKNEEYRIKNRDDHYYWYRVHSTVIRDKLGTPLRMIGFITDIDKQKKETMSLKEKAEHDLLTGLYNRMTTTALIDKAISKSDSSGCHALCAIDIDNFKNVNDYLGHLVGDEVIVDIAAEIKKQFREDDIMGRIGGDEFVVFLRDISPLDVERKAQILQDFFREIHPNQDKDYKITGSIGIAIYPRDGKNYRELFIKADTAMYAAKNGGKDTYCIYSKELESTVHDATKYDNRI